MPAKKSKKGPTKGSGGKGRRSLEGKKGTLPAQERHWYEGKQRRAAKKAQATQAQRRRARAAKAPDARARTVRPCRSC